MSGRCQRATVATLAWGNMVGSRGEWVTTPCPSREQGFWGQWFPLWGNPGGRGGIGGSDIAEVVGKRPEGVRKEGLVADQWDSSVL